MPLSKETKDRIAKDARSHWLNTKGDQGELDYIAGAEAEAERAAGLVSALEKIRDMAYQAGNAHIENVAIETLTKYNQSK